MNQDKPGAKNVTVSAVSGRKSRKWLIFGIVLLVVIIGAGIAIYQWQQRPKNPYHVDLTKLTPLQQAQYLSDVGDYKNAEKVWDKELAKAKDTQAKINIYAQQVATAAKFGQDNDAKSYADKAFKLSPNASVIYAALAQAAQTQGDKASAKKYWQQAIAKLDKNIPGYNVVLRDYENSLAALK